SERKDPAEDSGYNRVKKWTSKIDIFSKNLHWYLALICNPGALMNDTPPQPQLEEGPEVECELEVESPATADDDTEMVDNAAEEPIAAEGAFDVSSASENEVSSKPTDEPPERSDPETIGPKTGERSDPETSGFSSPESDPMTGVEHDPVGGELALSPPSEVDVADGEDTVMRPASPTSGLEEIQLVSAAPSVDIPMSDTELGEPEVLNEFEAAAVDPTSFYAEGRSGVLVVDSQDSGDAPAVANSRAKGNTWKKKLKKPPALTKEEEEQKAREAEEKKRLKLEAALKRCNVFILDSLGMKHSQTIRKLKDEAAAKKNKSVDVGSINGFNADIPLQTNHCDCGVYLLNYVEVFLKSPDRMMNALVNRMNTEDQWFTVESIEKKRSAMTVLFTELEEKSKEARQVAGESAPTSAAASAVADDDEDDECVVVCESEPESPQPVFASKGKRAHLRKGAKRGIASTATTPESSAPASPSASASSVEEDQAPVPAEKFYPDDENVRAGTERIRFPSPASRTPKQSMVVEQPPTSDKEGPILISDETTDSSNGSDPSSKPLDQVQSNGTESTSPPLPASASAPKSSPFRPKT
ncbi:hypothetical protein BDK51DRAFT_32789, partial [Blyttiomyces helicus]